MPAFAIGDPRGARLVDEVEAERAARLVEVQPVRVLVVRDVEVGPAVAVEVGERRAEAVVVRRRVEPGRDADLAELPVALVQEEQVAHALVVRREALRPSSRSGECMFV